MKVLHQVHHVKHNECICVSLQIEFHALSCCQLLYYMLLITVYHRRCQRCWFWDLAVCPSVRLESLTTLDRRPSRP